MKLPEGAGDWRLEGVPLTEWLRDNERLLVAGAVETLTSEGRADAAIVAELRWIVGYNIRLFIRLVDEPDLDLDETTGSDLVASAANRAAEGHPIESLLDSYVDGVAAVWASISSRVDARTSPDVGRIVDALFPYLRAVLSLVARGFQHEAAGITAGERDARFAAYTALISGTDPVHAAARAGVPLADRYLVLALNLGRDSGDAVEGRSAEIPRRRRLNEVRRVLDGVATGEVLALFGDPGATALVPVDESLDDRDVAELGDRLASATGYPLHAGAAFALVDEIPAAVAQAEEVLELVTAIGHPAGVWMLDDVLLPYQLTRPGTARDRLAGRLAVLDSHPDWEATMRAYVASGGDRLRTARHLHVHPNTVDYRLQRFAAAAGMDATGQPLSAVVQTALWVRDVTGARPPSL